MAQKTVAYTTGVTPGSYTSADITVDNQGLITAVANGSGGASTDNIWTSADYYPGALAGTGDPIISGATSMTSARMFVSRIKIPSAMSVSNIIFFVTLNTATFTAGQNFVGLYQGNVLIASSADRAASWQGAGTGYFVNPLVGAPIAVSAGYLDVVLLGTWTPGSFQTSSTQSGTTFGLNQGLAAPNFRCCIQSGLTALPADLNSTTSNFQYVWFAVS